jgi:hypothetical protein
MIATLLKRSIGRKPHNPWIIWVLRYGDLGSGVLGQGSDCAGQTLPQGEKHIMVMGHPPIQWRSFTAPFTQDRCSHGQPGRPRSLCKLGWKRQ